MARVKKKAPGVTTTKSAGSSVVVVAPPAAPAAPAAPKKRGGGRKKRAAPAAGRKRRGGRRAAFARARGIVGQGGKHALAAWQTSQPQLMTIGGAAVAGLLQRQGIKLPKLIDSLSTPVNVGLMAWVAARVVKSPVLDHLATGMLSVGAFGLGAGITIAGDEATYTMGDYNTMGTAVAYDDYAEGDYESDGDDD